MSRWVQEKGGCDSLPGRQLLKVFEVAHESLRARSFLDSPDPFVG
jgi:hypothetical protein